MKNYVKREVKAQMKVTENKMCQLRINQHDSGMIHHFSTPLTRDVTGDVGGDV